MLRSGRKVMFPVGLYGGLLFALVCLARPRLADSVQSYVAAGMVLPFRALGIVMPVEARATSSAALALASVARTETLKQRERVAFDRGTEELQGIPEGLSPVLCHVVDLVEKGAAGTESVLVLDLSYRDLGPVESFVTRQDVLLGFVAEPETVGPDASGRFVPKLDAAVRVELLHHRRRWRLPRRVAAEIRMPGSLERLRFLVEPGSDIDDWPLHCTLPEDPYLAATTMRTAGLQVWTSEFAVDPLGVVPSGLLIGKLQVFGYERENAETLPIDFFVEPVLSPTVLTTVVLWRKGSSEPVSTSGSLVGGELHPVRFVRLPAPPPGEERWFASVSFKTASLPVGAALVAGERLIGRVASSGPGYVFVSPFGEAGNTWPLVLLPEDTSLDPIGILARAIRRDPSGVTLSVLHSDRPLTSGQLYTGTVSLHCPSRLWIGAVTHDSAVSDRLFVADAGEVPFGGLAVFSRLSDEVKR